MAEKQTKKIAVIGDPATVLGFRGLGLETHAIDSTSNWEESLRRLLFSGQYGILYITNALAEQAQALLAEVKNNPLPAVIPIPMGPPAAPLGQLALQDAVKRAVGFNILANHSEEQ